MTDHLPITRAEYAARILSDLARRAPEGTRLGSKHELRERCAVSVGSFNEALRILQSRGDITVRPGPGGGIFVARQSALVRLGAEIRMLDRTPPDMAQVVRVVRALEPLIVSDAAAASASARIGGSELHDRLAALAAARRGPVSVFLRASLEVFSTLIDLGPNPILKSFAGVLLNAQLLSAIDVPGAIAPKFTREVDKHFDAVTLLVDAILAGDAEGAISVLHEEDLAGFFQSVTTDLQPRP